MGQVLAILVPVMVALIDKLFQRPPTPLPPPPAEHKITREEMIAKAQHEYGMDVVNDYNFGISGPSGAGKSTLINALRGLRDVRTNESGAFDERSSAAVGIIETTAGKPRRYRWPNDQYPHIAIWDMPGGNTQSNPGHSYFHDKALYAFDCLLLLSSTRFTALEAAIASQAKTFQTPVVLAISKGELAVADEISVRSDELGRDLTMAEKSEAQQEALAKLKKNAREELAKAGVNAANIPIYVICARSFGQLMRGTPQDQLQAPLLESTELVRHVIEVAVARRRAI